ncbi:MAG: hypothetical protein WD512_13635 [Candidatus Paceibacterota bacterium]
MEDKLIEYLEKIEKGVIDLAPKTWDILVQLKFMESLYSLALSIFFVVPILIYCINFLIKKGNNVGYDEGEKYIDATIFMFIVTIILTLFTLYNLLSIDTWLGVFNPQLAVIRDIVQSIK